MIDHVFTPKAWPIHSVTVGERDRSDHAPVLVDVEPS